MRLSILMAYYENPTILDRHIAALEALPDELKQSIELVVCDDGSPRWPARLTPKALNLQIYRISVDVRWNQDAARNLCARHARADWFLLTDIDHFIPRSTLEAVLDTIPFIRHSDVYRFERMSATTAHDLEANATPYKPHPNSWLMHRSMFLDRIGGYDERLAGYYGTDADFRDSVKRYARNVGFITSPLIRVGREIVADASTTTYERKAPEDKKLEMLRKNRPLGWRPLRYQFPYEAVLKCSL